MAEVEVVMPPLRRRFTRAPLSSSELLYSESEADGGVAARFLRLARPARFLKTTGAAGVASAMMVVVVCCSELMTFEVESNI